MTRILKAAVTALTMGALGGPVLAQELPNTILVLDASGSMWGQIDGVNKITIARDVVAEILGDFPAEQNLGLVSYGHRERGQCSDIELLVPPAPGTAGRIVDIVNTLNPRGMTPMADAVIAAAEALRYTENTATVILVSDGIETCNPDPCAAARALAAAGVDFTAHVIGFDVAGEAEALVQMRCMAEATGGTFHTADNAAELSAALREVVAAPVMADITLAARIGDPALTAPAWRHDAMDDLPLVIGPVAWTVTGADGVTLIADAEDNPLRVELSAGDYTVTLFSIVDEAAFDYRLTISAGGAQTVTAELPGTPAPPLPTANLILPASVVAGSRFDVKVEADGELPDTYLALLPAGTDDSHVVSEFLRLTNQLQGKDDATMTAPGDPGLYEIRLQAMAGHAILGRATLEVAEAVAQLVVPDQVSAGSEFTAQIMAAGESPRAYLALVPAGTDDGHVVSEFERLRDEVTGKESKKMIAPGDTGRYELRLQLITGHAIVARTGFEVVDLAVTLDAPARAPVGGTVKVGIQATGDAPRGYLALVPAGTDDSHVVSEFERLRDEVTGQSSTDLSMPAETGFYELRLQLAQNHRIVARTTIEVVPVNVMVGGPDRVRAGAEMTLHWDGVIHPNDYVTVVPMGTADGEYGPYVYVGEATQGKLAAPDEPGLYEIRYQLYAGDKVMARQALEVVAADAPLDDGAGLNVPGTGPAGGTITVIWTGGSDGADQRVTLARTDQPDFAWISAESTVGKQTLDITLPDTPGTYEVRYLDLSNQQVLGRAHIEVTE